MNRRDRVALRRQVAKLAGTAKASPGVRGPTGAQGPSGSVTDGDKGDITVSGSGSVWTLDLTLDEVTAPVASVNFSDQQALSFRIENRTSDPGAPSTGQIWLRTDL